MKQTHKNDKGFTLIELSIVLVIIGLLVGGVTVGQDMIEAARLRSFVSQMQKYNTAVNAYKLQYDCLPGDCADATKFFSADSSCTIYGATSASFRSYIATPNDQTCNGDGNGTVFGPSTAFGETYLFWQHLSLAGLVEGNYTGAPGKVGTSHTGSSYYASSLNVPKVTIPDAMLVVIYPHKEHSWWTGLRGKHYYWLGAPYNGTWDLWPQPVLTPIQAKLLDDKMDDGAPRSGSVQSDQRNTGCYTGSPATYRTNLTDKRCSMLFATGF